jgi:hypothetical protein
MRLFIEIRMVRKIAVSRLKTANHSSTGPLQTGSA